MPAALPWKQLKRYPELPHDLDELHRLSNPRQADFVDSEGKLIWRGNEVYFNFGKHKGTQLREVCTTDGEYVRWLIAKDFRADLQERAGRGARGPLPAAAPAVPDASTGEGNGASPEPPDLQGRPSS